MVIVGVMIAVLFALIPEAHAAGYHFFRVEAVSGASEDDVSAGLGFSAFSDIVHAWFTANPTGLREGWIESAVAGPVIGVVPPAFDPIVDPYPNDLLLPWTRVRVGGDAATRRNFSLDVAQLGVLDFLAFGGTDPRVAYAGPALGLGVDAVWWDQWKDQDAAVMTGKVAARGGLVAGATARDTVYAQASVLGRFDLFGTHQKGVEARAVAGFCLERAGVPLGLEVSGVAEAGDDNVIAEPATSWSAHGTLYWRVAPPHQTRAEELVQARLREMAALP